MKWKEIIIKILRTQIHVIRKNHRLYKYCDDVCFKSKNLYNYANFLMRQEFINNGKPISSFDLNKMLKIEDVFKELPAKTSQQIMILLGKNWKSFFRSMKDWQKFMALKILMFLEFRSMTSMFQQKTGTEMFIIR